MYFPHKILLSRDQMHGSRLVLDYRGSCTITIIIRQCVSTQKVMDGLDKFMLKLLPQFQKKKVIQNTFTPRNGFPRSHVTRVVLDPLGGAVFV